MAKDRTWRDVIEEVLKQAETAMHYKDVADQIVASGLRKQVGATPAATVRASWPRRSKNLAKSPPSLKSGEAEIRPSRLLSGGSRRRRAGPGRGK